MQLKNYQITAINKLVQRVKDLLKQDGEKNIVLKAPTGSGKTIITAEFLQKLVYDAEITIPFSFIWAAPRKLHLQSKNKLEKYYESTRILECSEFEDLTDKEIAENEILFLNWESINKKDKNTIVKENEKEFYLGKIVENTKNSGKEIILIIDESHHHATSDISRELISDIGPKLTLEVSATPVIINPDEIVSVSFEDVRFEGMVKKSVILNPDFENILTGENIKTSMAEGSDMMVLQEALKKRAQIVEAYSKIGIIINPLVLIQLPNIDATQEEKIKDEVEAYLMDKYDITIQNGRLGIYLSEEKENLKNISKDNNETEVLIFKQAIALGWDCPRAQILVLFREWKSLTFSIQTIGRIMRMPQPEIGHYEQEILNHGYVYTNLANIQINEDLARNYVTIFTSKRIDDYQPIKLESIYNLRQREKTRLSPIFVKLFIQEAINYKLKEKINLLDNKLELKLISNFEAENIDKLVYTDISANKIIDTENESDLQKLFDYFVRDNLTPLYPEQRSIGRVKESIYKFFKIYYELDYTVNFSEIIHIILSLNNKVHIANVIDLSKEKYLYISNERSAETKKISEWELPELLNYSSNQVKWDVKKSAMQPFYYDAKWKSESAFIKFLESSNNVLWWFKNGDRDSTYFAIPYYEDEHIKPFYIDFIVYFNNGEIGLYDTKSGRTILDAKNKSDGLQKYIKVRSEKGKVLKGGIITNTDPRDYLGRWIIFKGNSKDLKVNNYSNWETLEL